VAAAAVALAERVFGSLRGRVVLTVGAGETGRLAARHFAEREPARLIIANRTLGRAEDAASSLGGEAIDLAALSGALEACDVAISATSAPGFVVSAAMVAAAMRRRPHRPLVLVDIAMPRDIDPAAADCENVFLYPIDALRSMVDQSLARRARELPKAEAIVEDECARFLAWYRSLDARPVLRDLREHFERVRAEEVRRSLRHFNQEDLPHIERLTRSLVNRLLHHPSVRLRDIDPSSTAGAARLETVRDLFALDGGGSNSQGLHHD
jgi:glutamyl-tRNA reductase